MKAERLRRKGPRLKQLSLAGRPCCRAHPCLPQHASAAADQQHAAHHPAIGTPHLSHQLTAAAAPVAMKSVWSASMSRTSAASSPGCSSTSSSRHRTYCAPWEAARTPASRLRQCGRQHACECCSLGCHGSSGYLFAYQAQPAEGGRHGSTQGQPHTARRQPASATTTVRRCHALAASCHHDSHTLPRAGRCTPPTCESSGWCAPSSRPCVSAGHGCPARQQAQHRMVSFIPSTVMSSRVHQLAAGCINAQPTRIHPCPSAATPACTAPAAAVAAAAAAGPAG